MSVQSIQDFVFIPFPAEVYKELLDRYPGRVNSLIQNVVDDFLERNPSTGKEPTRQRGAGIIWETLFLPEKTKVRTRYLGNYKYAEIRKDNVLFEGKSYPSVSKAISKMRGNTSNNAWKVAEILLPTASKWMHASAMRRKGAI